MTKNKLPQDDVDQLLAHLAYVSDETQKHTSALLTIGYASYFGFWQITNEFLPKPLILLSALLMVISVSLFIFFEIWKSYLRSRQILTLNHRLNTYKNRKDDGLSKISEESELAFKNLAAKQSKVWVFVFWPTLGTGALSLILLLAAFARNLLSQL